MNANVNDEDANVTTDITHTLLLVDVVEVDTDVVMIWLPYVQTGMEQIALIINLVQTRNQDQHPQHPQPRQPRQHPQHRQRLLLLQLHQHQSEDAQVKGDMDSDVV